MLLQGITASGSGVISGYARVINDDSQLSEVKEGEILVIPTASPDYGPVLHKVRAVVSERGGRTAHLAIICREFNIPSVLGVQGAMTIQTGQWLTVDTTKGEIVVS